MRILMRDNGSKKWELVESNAYAAEKELQELLAESPELISLDEIRPGAGPLVASVREISLPVGYIDILAFTPQGDIVIVECKLAKNIQAKREVIGQILDYAAHLWELSYEDLDQHIHTRTGQSLISLMQAHTNNDPAWDEETFRANIESTLAQGNFILVIAVNEINDELHRIIRFINSSGISGFSFAALEMRRFQKSTTEMLVPHVFGPAPISSPPPKPSTRKWNEQDFFTALQETHPDEVVVARKILEWASRRVSRIWWGEGTRHGSFVSIYHHEKRDHQLFAVYTYGAVEIYFYWYQYKPPFDSEEIRLEILRRLNEIDGVNLPDDVIGKRPTIRLGVLANPSALEKFLAVFDWMLEEFKKVV
jgi:hypothetical protein